MAGQAASNRSGRSHRAVCRSGGPWRSRRRSSGTASIGRPRPGPRVAGTATGPRCGANVRDEPFYDTNVLRTLFLQFENADWEKELADFYNTDVDVPAPLTVDGREYRDVGVRFRGMSSFAFVSEGSKRSLNVSIDFADDNQRVQGYRTLNLLNANSDPTFVAALLYSHIARQYVPAARINYVRVVINGESWGVYLNAEQFNPIWCATGSRTRAARAGRCRAARSAAAAWSISARTSTRTAASTTSSRATPSSRGAG